MAEIEESEKILTKKEQKALKKEQDKQKKLEKRRAKREKQRKLLFPANKKGYHISHFMNFCRFIAYPLYALIYPFKRHGPKKVGKGAYIYVGNHYNIFDIFFAAVTTREVVHFIAKQSILEAPVLGALAAKVGVIGAMRDGSDIRTVLDCMKVLKNGEKVSMFPEGTRNKVSEEEFLPFHGGAAMLAIKTQTPIVPFVLCSRPRVFHRTHVVYGEPFELSEYYGKRMKEEDYKILDDMIRNKLYELRESYRAQVAAKKNKKRKKK